MSDQTSPTAPQSLKQRTLSNTGYNFAGYVFPIFFTVIITPIVVAKLGVQDYGLMVFITALLGILGLLDFGVSASTQKNLAQYMGSAEGDPLHEAKIRSLLRTSRSLFLGIGLAGIALISSVALFVHLFAADRIAETPEFYPLILISAITFFIGSQSNINNLIPNALERFDVGTKLGVANLVVGSLASLAVVLLGGKLLALFTMQAVLALAFFFISGIVSRSLIGFSFGGFGWNKEEVKKTISWSAYSSVNELARTSLFSLDRLVIPMFLGTASLAYYTLPGNVTARIPGVSDNLSGVMFPVSARLHGANDTDRLRSMYVRSSRLIMLVSFAITIAIIANGYEILRYWLSEDIATNSYTVLVILAITNFVLSLMSPVATYFMAMNRWKFYTTISVSMAVINLIAVFTLIPLFGIVGAGVAYLISTLPILWAIHQLEIRYLHLNNFWKKWAGVAVKFSVTGIAFFIVNMLLIKPFITSLPMLVVLGPLSVLVCFGIHYLFGFIEKEDVDDLVKFAKFDRNSIEDKKLKTKLFVRSFLPQSFLHKIRRRQVPLHKMLAFKEKFEGGKVLAPSKSDTLSVVMPCYGHAAYLGTALRSIANQTRTPDEVVVIDDASKDDTARIVREFADAHPELNIVFIKHTKNIGQALSISEGIQTATGDLVMIMNDDDVLVSNAVETMLALFKKDPEVALIGGGNIAFQHDGELRDAERIEERHVAEHFVRTPEDALTYEDYCSINMTHTGSTFSREKALSVGAYLAKPERIVKFSDRDFQIRMNLLYPVAVYEQALFCYWRTNSSVDSGRNS